MPTNVVSADIHTTATPSADGRFGTCIVRVSADCTLLGMVMPEDVEVTAIWYFGTDCCRHRVAVAGSLAAGIAEVGIIRGGSTLQITVVDRRQSSEATAADILLERVAESAANEQLARPLPAVVPADARVCSAVETALREGLVPSGWRIVLGGDGAVEAAYDEHNETVPALVAERAILSKARLHAKQHSHSAFAARFGASLSSRRLAYVAEVVRHRRPVARSNRSTRARRTRAQRPTRPTRAGPSAGDPAPPRSVDAVRRRAAGGRR